MHRIAVAGRKGGVGKTTVACGLASVFAHQKKRVLLIDLDPQSNVAFALGASPTAPGTAELLLGKAPQPLEIMPYLNVLPGGPELGRHDIQGAHPEDLADCIATLDYDVFVFDCPPGNEHLERFAHVAATSALVVADAHPLGIMGAGRVLGELKVNKERGRRSASRWAIVQSRIDNRRKIDKEIDKILAEHFPGDELLIVHQDVELANAAAYQEAIMKYAPSCRGAKELIKIAEWCENG